MIKLSKPSISSHEIEAVSSVLDSEYLGMGSQVKLFEEELSSYIGFGVQVACVNTGTSALHLACQCIGLGAGDEVLVPTLTYVASFQAISASGAQPVPCDVNENDALIDLIDAETRITKKTKAIMPVHYAGYVGDLDGIYDFARKHKLRVIEDAAHAFGSTYHGKKIGACSDIACFSFDGIKNITSGEGGAIASSDRAFIERVSDARLLGIMGDSSERYKKSRRWDFDVTSQGWRYHMSDLMASIGRVQLSRLESEFAPKRQSLVKHYRERLTGIKSIKLFDTDIDTVVPHIFPIRILGGKLNQANESLHDSDIQTGFHYKLNHLLSKYGAGSINLPVSEQLSTELITLPLHIDLTINDIDRIVEILTTVLGEEN